MKKNFAARLTESAVMLAFATVLSLVKLVDLPYGGSITACSMLPILIIAYRHGTPWGLLTGFVYGLLQMLLGVNNLSYATSALAAAAIIVLDYLGAFAVLGLAGLFRKMRSQSSALIWASVAVGLLRYVFHIISGCTVWAGLSIPTTDALLYSIAYNGTYMIPETIITAVGAYYLSRVLDFRGASIARSEKQTSLPDLAVLFSGIAKTALAFAVIWDVKEIAAVLQNPETGEFAITGITAVNWPSVAIVTAVCAAVFVLGLVISKRISLQNTRSLKGFFAAVPFLFVGAGAVWSGFFISERLQKISSKTASALEALTAGELSAAEAQDKILAAANQNWLQITLVIACILVALILVCARAAKRTKEAN